MSDEKQEPTFDTWLVDDIVCPYCGEKHDTSEGGFSDADAEEYECENPDCGINFTVTANHEITYTTSKRSQSPYELKDWFHRPVMDDYVVNFKRVIEGVYYARFFFPGNIPLQIEFLKWPCKWPVTDDALIDILDRWEETDDEGWVKPRMEAIAAIREGENRGGKR